MKVIVTHNGTFHADEITAIALIQIFVDPTVSIDRIPHQSTINKADYDYIIDIGREYDNVKSFDHHQWEGGKSSAGLIWEHIGLSNYPSIDALISAVDDNDVGRVPASAHEYSRLLSLFNMPNIHSVAQDDAFQDAVDCAVKMLMGLKRRDEEKARTEKIIATATTLTPELTHILDLKEYLPGWGSFVNGETMPNIEAVVWYDNTLKTYNIQTTNVSTSSYDKVGRTLLPWDKMNFVHAAGFFAVTGSYEDLLYYVKNYMK